MSFDFRLIEEVRAKPFLYDLRHKQYKKVDLKENVWSEIGEKLGKTGTICRKRWNNLRDHYRKLERKMCSQPSNSAPDFHEIKWAYYDALLFLKSVPTTKTLVDERVFPNKNNFKMTIVPHTIVEVLHNKEESESRTSGTSSSRLPTAAASSSSSHQHVEQPAKKRKRKKFSLLKDVSDFIQATQDMESPREKLFKGFAAKIDNFYMPELAKEELDASINNLIFEKFKEYLTE